jgi:hypothetical protein
MSRSPLAAATLLAALPAFAAQAPNPAPFEIYIDGQCRVYTQKPPTPSHPNPKAAFHFDDHVCHFESEHTSTRWDYIPNGTGTPKATNVTIVEHEYILTNPMAQPVTFVVGQFVPKNWTIDSDPQPTEITNSIAMFRVIAQPGQTVRLHVGAKR